MFRICSAICKHFATNVKYLWLVPLLPNLFSRLVFSVYFFCVGGLFVHELRLLSFPQFGFLYLTLSTSLLIVGWYLRFCIFKPLLRVICSREYLWENRSLKFKVEIRLGFRQCGVFNYVDATGLSFSHPSCSRKRRSTHALVTGTLNCKTKRERNKSCGVHVDCKKRQGL